MHAFVSLWLLLAPAHAITRSQSGPIVEAGVGASITQAPVRPALAGQLSLGWWRGTYDDAYAFGRYWALVQTTRIDALATSGVWTLAPMLELRRGIDIFVANPAGFLAVGPVLALPVAVQGEPAVGVTARGGLDFKWRRSRFWGLTVRLEGGVDVLSDRVSPAAGLLLGGGFARPARPMEKPKH